MNKRFIFIALFFILVLASVLRLWNLATVPASPDWDEAALGYNAYSIVQTGHDEYGAFLPVIFRSFDDYKPGLYIYLIVPFVKLFGLSLFVTRLPAALFGILAVLGTFLLIKKLFDSYNLALVTAFLLAISPWHIQFTHAAFEASVGVTFNIFTIYFFLKSLEKSKYLFASVLCSVLGIYVYQSEKVFVPLLCIALVVIYWKQVIYISKKYIILSVLFGIILLLPLLSFTLSNHAIFARAAGVSVFSDTSQILKNTADRLIVDQSKNDIFGLIFDNRRYLFAKEIIANYLSHFDLNWLFLTGDIERHHAPGMGLLYLWDLPFLIVGIYMLLFGNYSKKTKLFIFSWFLLVPIPAAVTTGVPHAIRTINFLPLFSLFTAIGIRTVIRQIASIRKQVIRISMYTGIFCLFIFNFVYYLNQYFVQQNYYNSEMWQYGYAQAVPVVQAMESKYKKIIVSNQPYMDQSYVFFLFYLHYPPQQYQQDSMKASGGFREDHVFGKYEFRPIHWDDEVKSSDILYVGRVSDFPSNSKKIRQIDFLNGKPAMLIVHG